MLSKKGKFKASPACTKCGGVSGFVEDVRSLDRACVDCGYRISYLQSMLEMTAPRTATATLIAEQMKWQQEAYAKYMEANKEKMNAFAKAYYGETVAVDPGIEVEPRPSTGHPKPTIPDDHPWKLNL